MTDKPTDEALENLFVEETGFATDDFPVAIFDFARAVLAKWGTLTAATAEMQPLTDRQIGAVIDEVATTSRYGHHHFGRWMDFARAIEAEHGIKATNQESNK